MKAQILLVGLLASMTLGLHSCEFEEPDFSDVSNFKFQELNGDAIDFSFDVKVDNPNKLGFKIKNGKVDITGNGKALGTVTLDEKIKIKRKSANTYTVPLTLDLSKGGLFNLIKLATAGEVELKLDGKVRGSVMGIGKSIEIHETKSVSGSDLKLPEM